MRHRLKQRFVQALTIIGVCLALQPVKAGEPGVGLTVRVYNAYGLPVEMVEQALTVAGPILDDAGLNVTFRHCRLASADPEEDVDVCTDRLNPGEVVVRVVDAPLGDTLVDPRAFGFSYVVRGLDRGWLATVFADRTLAAAKRVHVASGALLGRVLAHEVGHLLLGSSYHADTGVMRAHWPDETLQQQAKREWRFSDNEAQTMQHKLLARSHPASN